MDNQQWRASRFQEHLATLRAVAHPSDQATRQADPPPHPQHATSRPRSRSMRTEMLRDRLARRFAVVAMVGAAIVPLGVTTVSASTPLASPLQAGMNKLAATYGTGAPDLFGAGGFGWQSAVAQSTVEAYEQTTGDRRYLSDIASAYSKYVSSDPRGFPDFEDGYIDDTGWWGIAWLQAYLLTGHSSYLKVAEADATYMYHKGWDSDSSSCGGTGGVWWYVRGTPTGRLAISNELFLELTAWLYNETKNSTYLGWANDEWSWFEHSGLISSHNQVYDGFNGSCSFAGANIWSYNQGVILGGLAQLSVATGNTSLLTRAEDIASAEINSSTLDPGDVLQEPCAIPKTPCPGNPDAFKGIFVQNLKMLATVAGTSQFNSFFQDEATAVGGTDINSSSQFGMFWDAPLSANCSSITPSSWVSDEANNYCNSATQASALDALIAAYVQQTAAPRPRPSIRKQSLLPGRHGQLVQ